ncbi:uncharacterized protein LOC103514853 isoform X2 [Diaphorina citri]|uniref:Uncharacterized protein LOC103514853 isoform X2 n=1 Tax=Diaphorina citri TaxID=121845 RepID=A0A1S3DAY0_DIACI|nr:uncharacterized protein LOC103514853 isoform X2 [Diaphorina citri]
MNSALLLLGVTICLRTIHVLGRNRTALENIVHMSYLRLKCAPSILWHQMQARAQIHNETHDALEREEMNKYAHEFDVHYSVIDSFFKAQQEANLLVRYSLLGSNITTRATKTIIKDPKDLDLKLTTITKVILENMNVARDNLISGDCRSDLSSAINAEVEEWKIDDLHETALTRALGYLIDICQLHFSWIQGSPEYRKIVL